MSHREVEDAILNARSIYDVVNSFDSTGHAIEATAAILAQHHGRDRIGTECERCRCSKNLSVLERHWATRYDHKMRFKPINAATLFVGASSVTSEYKVVAFQSYHPVCVRCRGTCKLKRALGITVKTVSFSLLFPAVFLMIFMLLKFTAFKSMKPLTGSTLGDVGLLCGGGALGSLFIAGHIVEDRLQIPQSLKMVGKMCFGLAKAKWYSYRDSQQMLAHC